MSSTAARLHMRYRVAVPVRMRLGGRWVSLLTEDVGLGGVFIRTEAAVPLRQLVRIELELPWGMGALEAPVVVARIVAPGAPGRRIPGLGMAFYGLGRDAQERWDRFLREAARRSPGSSEKPLIARRVDPRDPGIDPERRARVTDVLEISLAELEDLFVLYSRDVSRGGIFLATDHVPADGERVGLRVVHAPTTSVVWLEGEVKRSVRTRGQHGVGVELALDDAEARSLRAALEGLVDAADDARTSAMAR